MDYINESPNHFENGIFQLFDKYLKASDNYLPLKAYLECLENDNYDEFSLISNVKTINPNLSSENFPPPLPVSTNLPLGKPGVSNLAPLFTTTLNLFKKQTLPNEQKECFLSQKLYKIVISIDYSPQTTSLDYLNKSLDLIFQKVSREYDEYYESCYGTEPQIYVTCLLWNIAYFYQPQSGHYGNVWSTDESLHPMLPFTIITHSKRLLKSNINEMAKHLFAKINESKSIIIDSFMNANNNDYNFARFSMYEDEHHPHSHSHQQQSQRYRIKSPFEEFLRIIIRIFDYFCINEVSTSLSAPTSLACSHHIHITDGLINAADMVKCIDKISRTAISYSFIYSGQDNLATGSNISSSFGHLADYSLMKFIAYITGGFYFSVDENLDTRSILERHLFYFYNISPIFHQLQSNNIKTSSLNKLNTLVDEFDARSIQAHFNSCDENDNEENRDYFSRQINLIKYSDKISLSNRGKIMKKLAHKDLRQNEPGADIRQLLIPDSILNDQLFEFKCIQKYELTQRVNNVSLLQLVRIRAHEGFYLFKIARETVKTGKNSGNSSNVASKSQSPSKKLGSKSTPPSSLNQITLYFKKYFTQTITLIYKISYLVPSLHGINTIKLADASGIVADPPSIDSTDQQTSSTPTKASRLAQHTSSSSNKLYAEIWISWNFLHLRSKYQNLELIKKVKLFLNNLHSADYESTLDLTPAMTNIPEILKLKEPLFKLLLIDESNSNDLHKDVNKALNESIEMNAKSTPYSLNNLNFELNIRLSKMVEKDMFQEFANAWKYLAFFKFSKSVLIKCFGLHSLKVILDHDRPMPDINSVVFDLKSAAMLAQLEMLGQQNFIQGETNGSTIGSSSFGNRISSDYFAQSNLNINTNTSSMGHQHYNQETGSNFNNNPTIININHNTIQNNIFQCLNSLNKLRAMLTEWCDVMLVENCVYLKFLSSSSKFNRRKLIESENSKKHSQTNQIDKSHLTDEHLMTSTVENTSNGSSSGEHLGTPELKKTNPLDPTSTNDPAASTSPATPNNSSTSKQANSSCSSSNVSKNSFVMIKLDCQYIPCVSLQFLFHSNVSYLDRTRLLEQFKGKLNEFNSCSKNNIPSPNANNSSNNTALQTPTSSYLTQQQQGAMFVQQKSVNNSSLINLSFDESQQQLLPKNLTAAIYQSSNIDSTSQECCHLLHKPDLYDAFKYALFEDALPSNSEYLFYRQHQQLSSELNQRVFYSSSKSINFMQQKRYKWKINKQFSFQTSQILKETIIDVLVRTRLKEGFKCLFKCPKFAVFTIQLTMFDSGEVNFDQTLNPNATNNNAKNPQTPTLSNQAQAKPYEFKQARGSSQICTFIYVIRFVNNFVSYNQNYDTNNNNSASKLSNKQGLLNIVTGVNSDVAGMNRSDEDVYFQTELYFEAIDGIHQERKMAGNLNLSNKKNVKEKLSAEYFKNLNTLEISNLIYLVDMKCFSTLQSIYALFLSKSNTIQNLSTLINAIGNDLSKVEIGKSNLCEFSSEILNNIISYNMSFAESVRLLPDLSLILKKHSLKETRSNSTGSSKQRGFSSTNLYNRIKINQPRTNSTAISTSQLNNSNSEMSPISSSLEDPKLTKDSTNKPKKNETIALQEQLRPLLNSLDISGKFLTNVDFDFTLRGILLESTLYVCVFEDIPFNLFSTSHHGKSLGVQHSSTKKIQQFFFASINEQFRNFDHDQTSIQQNQHHSSHANSSHSNRSSQQYQHHQQRYSDDQSKLYDSLIEGMKRDVKNAISLKLNDIKSGDSTIKQIIENLRKKGRTLSSENEDESNFKIYIKFQILQTTAKQTQSSSPLSSANLTNNSGSNQQKSNDFFRQTSASNTNNFIQQSDIDSNKFFIYGLFFLNTNETGPGSNRLVFFLFNCVPENIKHSLIQTQTNTYLIRKSLFSTSKVDFRNSFSDTYKFYFSKNAARKSTNIADIKMNSNSSKNLIKKCFSISDILKYHLNLNLSNNQNDSYLITYLDRIEDKCAKSYIRSLIHYLATYSIVKQPRLLEDVAKTLSPEVC